MKVNLLPISFFHEIKDLLFYFRSRLIVYFVVELSASSITVPWLRLTTSTFSMAGN